jgi:hypothetical protein
LGEPEKLLQRKVTGGVVVHFLALGEHGVRVITPQFGLSDQAVKVGNVQADGVHAQFVRPDKGGAGAGKRIENNIPRAKVDVPLEAGGVLSC